MYLAIHTINLRKKEKENLPQLVKQKPYIHNTQHELVVSNILRHAAEWFQLQEGELMNQTPPRAASHYVSAHALHWKATNHLYAIPNWPAKQYVLDQLRNEAIKCLARTHVFASPS